MSVRVVIADDQTSVREALATMLDLVEDISVVATAADGEGAIAEVDRVDPDVVLMDLRMPGIGGVEATAQLHRRHPDLPVVVLTTFADDESILGALGAGAVGYLTKDAGRHEIAAALRAAVAGQSVLDRAVQARLLAAARPTPSTTPSVELTPRETEVLRHIAEGLTNREIAAALFVSEATVKTHINNLFAKAGLRDRAQAVHYAFTNGVVG